MKKICLLLISLIILVSMASCGNNTSKTNSGQEKETSTQSNTNPNKEEKKQKEEIKTIAIGSTINGKSADITINKIELSYDVLPDKMDGLYTHYPADTGKVYINIDVDVKNTQKQQLQCDKIMKVEADYNGGFKYNSQPVVEDSRTGFTYANITDITPLETKGMRFLISCPEEVEKTTNPLKLTFDIDGEKYSYTVR